MANSYAKECANIDKNNNFRYGCLIKVGAIFTTIYIAPQATNTPARAQKHPKTQGFEIFTQKTT